jgi:hypothetical protein
VRYWTMAVLLTSALVPALARGGDGWPGFVDESVAALERALQAHDYAAVEPLLAPGFSYAGHGGGLALTIMRQVVEDYPEGLADIEILEVRQEPDGTLGIRTGIHTAGATEHRTLRLAGDGRFLEAEVAGIRLAGHAGSEEVGGGQLPDWSVALENPITEVPFELRDEFPIPLVDVRIGEHGPYRFAVDTAAACTVLLRSRLAEELNLERQGSAGVSDSSGQPSRPADLVLLPELRFGDVVARDLSAVSHTPAAAHAASIPDDVQGILGRVLFESLLLTLDYPGRRLILKEGTLEPGPAVVPFDLVDGVMQIAIGVGGRQLPVILDSGHRGTLTLPRSWAEVLPLAGPVVADGRTATVNAVYSRETAHLAGSVEMGRERVASPALHFADEHSPTLLGGGLLREFSVTVDQRARLVRFERDASGAAPRK